MFKKIPGKPKDVARFKVLDQWAWGPNHIGGKILKIPLASWAQSSGRGHLNESNKQLNKKKSSKFLILSKGQLQWRLLGGKSPLDGAIINLTPYYNSQFCVSFHFSINQEAHRRL